VRRAERLAGAIEGRYPALLGEGKLYTYMSVKDYSAGSRLETIDAADTSSARQCACGCNKSESMQ